MPSFILNVNNVQKVDYNENEKSIHLTNQIGESCILKSDDLKTLNAWINVIVDKCDFNQEESAASVDRGHRLPPLPEISSHEASAPKSSSKPLAIKSSNHHRNSTLAKQNSDTGHSRFGSNLQPSSTSHSLSSRTQTIYCSNINQLASNSRLNSRKNRNIAGQAASSVGSMQEHLFRTSSKNSLGTDSNNNSLVDHYIKSRDASNGQKLHVTNSSFENYSAGSSEHMNRDCDGYINLDDCESGSANNSRSNPPNKLQYKSQSTDILNQGFRFKPNRNAIYDPKASDSYDEDEETDYSSFRLPQETLREFGSSENYLTDQPTRNKSV